MPLPMSDDEVDHDTSASDTEQDSGPELESRDSTVQAEEPGGGRARAGRGLIDSRHAQQGDDNAEEKPASAGDRPSKRAEKRPLTRENLRAEEKKKLKKKDQRTRQKDNKQVTSKLASNTLGVSNKPNTRHRRKIVGSLPASKCKSARAYVRLVTDFYHGSRRTFPAFFRAWPMGLLESSMPWEWRAAEA
ncbi:hypothetical protein HRR83_007631 [Exophiala dermatitidis]|nr:hypothetical protein HRR74_007131 [Exophiala dermatitidis]KAJ4521769.1 hypothetical protein HRR73_002967 [Exophiala dermatitidis]KAJ4565910.1 hypothetical protein HRR81_007577 [Exophiala dermatitidis]KAJ4589485.1 hypothetical protein HRR84_007891 [Exophiala dermatitidis]KAJ4591130.1 hypothetical protein HRR83_007631 [Exophiala dermatitidis]